MEVKTLKYVIAILKYIAVWPSLETLNFANVYSVLKREVNPTLCGPVNKDTQKHEIGRIDTTDLEKNRAEH